MTARGIKTVMSASLVVALMLSLSLSGSVRATNNEQSEDPRLEKLAELERHYTAERSDNGKPSEELEAINVALDRIQLARDFVILENSGQADSIEAQEKIQQLAAYQEGIKYKRAASTDNHLQWSYDTYETSTVTRDRCFSPQDDEGSASGTITGYSSSAYLVGTLSYPDDITTGSGLNCTYKDWESAAMSFVRVDNPLLGCIMDEFTSEADTESGLCYDLEQYDVVLATVGSSKYEGTEFGGIPSTMVVL